MTAEPTAERTILAANFLGSGLQVLNLGWIGMSLGEPAGFRGPGNPANLAFARGGARSGRVGAANPPSRVLVGPQPSARRGNGPTPSVRGVDVPGRGVPLTQSDRTVRGNTVPIGDAGRVGQRFTEPRIAGPARVERTGRADIEFARTESAGLAPDPPADRSPAK